MTRLIYGVTPLDFLTFSAAGLIVFFGAVVAAMVPAVRVARDDSHAVLHL
jgi:hypothetical protein